MKIYKLKTALLLAFLVGGLFFISCEDSEVIDAPEISEALTEDETIAITEADDVSDELDNLIDDYLFEDELSSKDELALKDDGEKGTGRPDCAVKTVVMEGTTRTITFDFGEGCEFPNGHIVAGKIIISHEFDVDAMTMTITQTYEGFTFNDVMVEGENIIVRTYENENGNPESVKTMDITMTWEDGETASRVGTKTREWVEGYDTREWADNVFEITGNWATTFKNGVVVSATITKELRREMSCRFIVSGTIELTKNDVTGILDFGDGTCDDIAIYTDADGVETEITLRKRNCKIE
ncbi:hypothetical protein R3X25_07075 [Lutibacter sp. TH_r2]|uniref:hypothetical protein n=1 Tax=Lutibacter sp. TH_r2 TaxID=3082083 RepID=UPI0029548E13|nr:hypothetical protein [Lutibacter sp. TH_r2]MDV7187040.1 hypothetical protein [Lutibacter sp. TH_r2]